MIYVTFYLRYMKTGLIIFISLIFLISCSNKKTETPQSQQNQQQQTSSQKKDESRNAKMKVTSTAFKEGGLIPSKFTCDGDNLSPELSWSGVPDNTKSFAIVCDDPDAPSGDWVHWVIYNIPPDVKELTENTTKDKTLDNGSMQGKNDFGKTGYDGPCPPGGTHRYYFRVYALDTMLDTEPGLTKNELLRAMQSHILDQMTLLGKYHK